MTKAQQLIHECRELEIVLYGKRIELCMIVSDREGAEFWKKEMYACIEARNAALEVASEDADYFGTAGAIDRAVALAGSHA